MNRLPRLTRVLCGLLSGFVLAPIGSATLRSASPRGPDARPNIVFIISDDQGWNDYSFMGHPHIATPSLDRLAARSLTFARGYSPVPLCRPSLATITTGLYPHQHGVTGNDPALPDKDVNAMTATRDPKYARYYQAIVDNFRQRPNFVRDLVAQGYRALETGKWWEGDPVTASNTVGLSTAGRNLFCLTHATAPQASLSSTTCSGIRGRKMTWRPKSPNVCAS